MYIKKTVSILTALQIAVAGILAGCGSEGLFMNKKPVPEIKSDSSTFFSTVHIEDKNTVSIPLSDGDLWPSAWAEDDYLYVANGDGKGLTNTDPWNDIVVGRVSGNAADNSLTGLNLAAGDEVAKIWSDPDRYNRKPTGMVCVDGVLYLAVQDLCKAKNGIFDDAPAASIYKSTDKGKTWTGTETPMFKDHKFTTVMFLDYGQNYSNCPDEYVYAYGLDYNWRDSFTNTVIDPTDLYLARVHKDSIMDITKWEYFSGTDSDGNPTWDSSLDNRRPVLSETRKVYSDINPVYKGISDMTVLSQGSIVYNKPLNRYIYTSWTEYTFEFYESPTPYGPWKLFLEKDFGGYPWTSEKHGGYACTIPSKFISEDGKEMWVFSATFNGETQQYRYTGRKLTVEPYDPEGASNGKSDKNLAVDGAVPYTRSNRHGNEFALNDGKTDEAEDSWTGEIKSEDWWGYTYSDYMNFNSVEYTTGNVDEKGGFFEDIRVQVRRGFEWVDVKNAEISPEYTFDSSLKPFTTFKISFDEIDGDGIRIYGTPGGTMAYTGISELAVYYR